MSHENTEARALPIGAMIWKGTRIFKYEGARATHGRLKLTELRGRLDADGQEHIADPQVIRLHPKDKVQRLAPGYWIPAAGDPS